jgi:hypothetical protein
MEKPAKSDFGPQDELRKLASNHDLESCMREDPNDITINSQKPLNDSTRGKKPESGDLNLDGFENTIMPPNDRSNNDISVEPLELSENPPRPPVLAQANHSDVLL